MYINNYINIKIPHYLLNGGQIILLVLNRRYKLIYGSIIKKYFKY